MKTSRLLLLVAVILCASAMSFADTFSFSFTSATANISGQLTGTQIGSTGVFNITSGFGTFTDNTGCCGGVYNVIFSSNYGFSFDNLLTPGALAGGLLDVNGLLVFKTAGGLELNIFGNGIGQPYSLYVYDAEGFREAADGAFYLTPEPASLMMFGSGLLGLGGLIRRKLMV
jgi:hypothetical protein